MTEELINRLEKCRVEKLQALDLGKFKLEEIPKVVYTFDWLKELCFGKYYDFSTATWKGEGQCKLKYIDKEIIQLKSLKSLILAGSTFGHSKPELVNFDPIWDLVNLEKLVLDSTKISRIEKISRLKNLKYLGLTSTEIKDFTPLSSLQNLETLLLGDNGINNIEFLHTNIKLKHINLTSNKLTNLKSLSNKTDLERICICHNDVESIAEIHTCKKIKHLCLGGTNNFNTGKDLKEFPNLEDFSLSGFATLEEIESNLKLKEITVQLIDDENIEKLNKYVDCEELTIYGSFKEIKSLDNLKKLKRLYLISGELNSIQGLELKNLIAIGITTGKLKNLHGIEKWTNLGIIEISENSIESIEGVEKLIKLETLSLSETNVQSLKPIVQHLENNPNFFLELYNNRLPEELVGCFEQFENEGVVKFYNEKADNRVE